METLQARTDGYHAGKIVGLKEALKMAKAHEEKERRNRDEEAEGAANVAARIRARIAELEKEAAK